MRLQDFFIKKSHMLWDMILSLNLFKNKRIVVIQRWICFEFFWEFFHRIDYSGMIFTSEIITNFFKCSLEFRLSNDHEHLTSKRDIFRSFFRFEICNTKTIVCSNIFNNRSKIHERSAIQAIHLFDTHGLFSFDSISECSETIMYCIYGSLLS